MAVSLIAAAKSGAMKVAENANKAIGEFNSLEKKEFQTHELHNIDKNGKALLPDVEKAKHASLESVVLENKELAESLEPIDKFRLPNELEQQEIKEKTGMTDANLRRCTINEDGSVVRLRCVNDEFVGHNHPETGIPYKEKYVDYESFKLRVGVPEFPSVVECYLPKELRFATEKEQFGYLNKNLGKIIEDNPSKKTIFNERQVMQIEQGYKPQGYTWHHTEDVCKMQLVKTDIHSQTRHTGGMSMWAGGY